ncbi:MAG: N-acetylneuraminate synthase family protein [Chloroflexi bacterium]|nr:N-acetylneuraminate synthase family protein [Chloroflexota bacterium]
MARELVINGTRIDDESPCYVIAEIGHNHQGSVEKAKELFRQAKECGASAVKLQKRDNETLFTRAAFNRPYDNENSFGPTYGIHRQALELGRSEYVELQAYAAELGIDFFATPFDIPSADFLEDLNVPFFKIASADLTNVPLLRHVARLGKPMLVSTGGASLEDVDRAVETILPINTQLCILQCTASYPADFAELDLRVIETYRQRFPEVTVGWSGHDSGIAMALIAFMLGARVIEKHFTLNRAMKGTDHIFSLEPVGLRKMIRDLTRTRMALGDGQKRKRPSEAAPMLKMAKSLYAARSLPAGHVLTEADVAIKTPGGGMPAYELDTVIGRVLLVDLTEDDAFTPEQLGAAVSPAGAGVSNNGSR